MAGRKGFRHDPLADINLIRDNLQDRYSSGFPIIKELVQNADDAEASRLEPVNDYSPEAISSGYEPKTLSE